MIIIEYNTKDRVINIYTNILSNGGEGSGNFGHEGRPGKVGGSGEGGEQNKKEVKEIIEKGNNKHRSDKLICKDISNLDFIKNFHKQDNLNFDVLKEPPQKDNSYLFYKSSKGTATKPSSYYIMKKNNDYYFVRGSDHWGEFGTNISTYSKDDIQEVLEASEKMTPSEFKKVYSLNFERNFLDDDVREELNKKYKDDPPKLFGKITEEEIKKFLKMDKQEKTKMLDEISDYYGRIGRKKHYWNINDNEKGYKYGAIKIS